MYGWLKVDLVKKRSVVNTSTSFRSRELWDILGEKDIRCGVIDMPTTYPPKKINGFMVCHSFLKARGFTYPGELEKELKDKFGYKLVPDNLYMNDPDLAVEECRQITEQRFDVAEYLVKKMNPAFLHLTLFYTDHIQHYYWKYMEQGDNKKYGKVIEDLWVLIDRRLGELLKSYPGEDGYVILMSDHGFTPLRGEFALGKWLYEKGYVTLTKKAKLLSGLPNLGITRERLFPVFKRMKVVAFLTKLLPEDLLMKIYFTFPTRKGVKNPDIDWMIDWDRSKIIPMEGLYINRAAVANYREFREKLISEMKDIVNPETGERLYREVYRREDIFRGPYAKHAPDIRGVTNDGYMPVANFGARELWDSSRSVWSAHHHPHGVFCISGPMIKEGREVNASIYDLAPTILHIFGVPIPMDMDGRVLREVFEPGSFHDRDPLYEGTKTLINRIRKVRSSLPK